MRKRVVRVIHGVNMGLEHEGLRALMKEAKINLDRLPPDELILCINRPQTACKVIAAQGQVLGYLRMSDNSKITMNHIAGISEAFGGERLKMQSDQSKFLKQVMKLEPDLKMQAQLSA